MGRIIKFRAWWKDTNRLVGEFMGDSYGMSCLNNGHFIVEQFTGLHDKKGREIYEGDVLRSQTHKFGNTTSGRKYKIVKWLHTRVYNGWNVVDMGRWEVIGNRWENPELLP